MKIIKQRERCERIDYFHDYRWRNDKNAGFSFPCDENGNLLTEENIDRMENYNKCKDGTYDVVYYGIGEYNNHWTEPAVGICDDCGAEVQLTGFTNTCDECGADYNMSGQHLAPREQWGEETGETAEDILSVDYQDDFCDLYD